MANTYQDRPRYYVEVNGVIVGVISDAQMTAIQSEVKADAIVLFRQTISIVRAVACFVREATTALVFICTVGILFLALLDPSSMSKLIAEMAASPAAVEGAAHDILNLWSIVCIMMLLIAVLRRDAFGLVDHFTLGVATRLRQQLAVAADGDVQWREESRQSMHRSDA